MTPHIEKLQSLINQLRSQPPARVGAVIAEPLYSQMAHQGLYEIRDPEDATTIYIGKTTCARDGVAQRIWDHAKNVSGLLDKLKLKPEQFKDYLVRTIAVPDGRVRGLAEYYGIAIHDPRGNLVG